MLTLPARRVALLALNLLAPLSRSQGQATIDTLAIARLVGKAIGREAKGAVGPYLVDTAAAGSRFSLAAIEASGLRVALVSGARSPVCQFHPTKVDPDSPYLFSLTIDSVTSARAVVSSDVVCDQGPFRGYWARIRYELRTRNGHWRILPGRRATVT